MTGTPNDYREFLPPPGLRDQFLCLWSQSIGDSAYAHRVLPDGCIDLVFVNDEPPVFVGPWTKPFTAQFAPGTTVLGARWHIGHAPCALGVSAAEMRNQFVPVGAVWGDRAAADLYDGRSALADTLMRRAARAKPLDVAVDAGIRWLAAHPHGRIAELSRYVGLSRRHLQRRFAAAVGYGPKTFQSVLRFQRLLFLAGTKRIPTLGQLSVDAGYVDHAHMAHEVQRLAETSPTVLFKDAGCTLGLSDYLVPNLQDAGDAAP